MQYSIAGNTFYLLPQKAIYWKDLNAILISDPHFGKVAHFRKHGSYVPEKSFTHDLHVLEHLLMSIKPIKLIILGDMFHSKLNEECYEFSKMINGIPTVKTLLVKGNHDILPLKCYEEFGIKVVNEFIENNILLSHHPIDNQISSGNYVISGHVHPAFILNGKGKQNIKMPCFVFGERQALMPAFGNFTGNKVIKAQSGDIIFVIAGEKILEV